MSSRQSQFSQDFNFDVHEKPLLIEDLVRYLSQLASLNGEHRTGNRELSLGLRQLARALRPHADCTISEFVDQIKERTSRNLESTRPQKVSLPPSLESVSQKEVEELLGNESYTKTQIIEIGIRRFGIPRSKLERSNKQDVLNSVYAALDHERSLDVISKEASRGVRVS